MGGSGSGNKAWGAGYHAGKQEGFNDGSLLGAAGGFGAAMLLWGATWSIGKVKARRASERERSLTDAAGLPTVFQEEDGADSDGDSGAAERSDA